MNNNQYPNIFAVDGLHFSLPAVSFDLQIHSAYSDGTEFPKDLVDQAFDKKINLISITDHNSIKAYNVDLFEKSLQQNMQLIPGVEIDCFGELDILVYDTQANKMSDAFQNTIEALIQKINQKRDQKVQQVLENLKHLLQKEEHPSWLNWHTFSDKQQQKLLADLNLGKLQTINIKTNEPLSQKRDFIGKVHLVTLLARHNLVNTEVFRKEYSVSMQEAPSLVVKKFFKKYLKWLPNDLTTDWNIVDEIAQLPFISIVAHPGKTYSAFTNNPTRQSYKEFIKKLLDRGISGVECDYRNYKEAAFNYNVTALESLKKYANENNKILYATGGTDAHTHLK